MRECSVSRRECSVTRKRETSVTRKYIPVERDDFNSSGDFSKGSTPSKTISFYDETPQYERDNSSKESDEDSDGYRLPVGYGQQRGRLSSSFHEPSRSRSLSKSRSNSLRSSLRASHSSNDKVHFAIDDEEYGAGDSVVSKDCSEDKVSHFGSSGPHHGRGRADSRRSSSRKSRSLSVQKRDRSTSCTRYVDFDPPMKPANDWKYKKGSYNSNETEETTLTINDDDDDSFGMDAHESILEDFITDITDVVEENEEDEVSVYSERSEEMARPSRPREYDPTETRDRSSSKPRISLSRKYVTADDTHEEVMPVKHHEHHSMHKRKSKVKAIQKALHIGKRRTAPINEETYSVETPATLPSDQEDHEARPSLLVESAQLSLMLLQKESKEHSSKKGKSRLSKLLHR
jgi:hypothetical protein